MDAFNPLLSQIHQAAQTSLNLQREAGELLLAQAKTAETQLGAALEAGRDMFAAQHNAALAMGKVLADSVKPVATTKA